MLSTCGQPVIQNIVLALKNTEHIINVDKHTKKIMIQVRQFKELLVAFNVNESGTNYFTIKSGCTYFEDNVQGPFIMAIQAVEDNTTVEYVTWSHWD